MKKLLLILLTIFLCGCSNNLTKSNETRYYFPQGFSIDFKGYENPCLLVDIPASSNYGRGISLCTLFHIDEIYVSAYPFDYPKDIEVDFTDEATFYDEITKQSLVVIKSIFQNSTITKVELNDGFVAYITKWNTKFLENSKHATIFKNSKFVTSLSTTTNVNLENILHSIKGEEPKDKNYYLKQARSDKNNDLLHLLIYYLYNPNDNEINEEILRILNSSKRYKTLFDFGIQAIESRMNE